VFADGRGGPVRGRFRLLRSAVSGRFSKAPKAALLTAALIRAKPSGDGGQTPALADI